MNLDTMFKKSTASTALAVRDSDSNTEEWVTELNGVAVADSRNVAKVFGKEHKNVLRAIDDINADMYPLIEENLVAQNCAAKFFIETTHENRGKQYRARY